MFLYLIESTRLTRDDDDIAELSIAGTQYDKGTDAEDEGLHCIDMKVDLDKAEKTHLFKKKIYIYKWLVC